VIALIYLIYNGIQMMTAAGDDSKYKKWAASARAATIALVGIGTSALIVRTIFWLIGFIITP
jgi:threonine/homoserine/homoserine lactone efflux protein